MLLEMNNINKRFSKTKALSDAHFELEAGEVHALLGENGAGKSTLIKILGGLYDMDSGSILINGEPVKITNVTSARKHGISIIHQELMLVPHMTIAENIFLGQEKINKLKIVNKRQQNKKAQKLLDSFESGLSANSILGKLTIAEQQMVEIIRAVSFGAKIIVMDEPTSSLSTKEVSILYEIIRKLKAQNVGIVYISHRMEEIFEMSDRVTVLRDGEYVGTVKTAETNNKELIKMMVGRELSKYYVKTNTVQDEVVLKVEHLSDGKTVKDVSFELRRGEILGFSGLIGAGRSEVMKCLFGLSPVKSGTITINGKKIDKISNPRKAISLGIAMVPEDRKNDGLFLKQETGFNLTINVLNKFLKSGVYKGKTEAELINNSIDSMQVKVSSPKQIVAGLSGGNQQKVLIGKWLLALDQILIMDEPTRGVDVKTKAEIYELMNSLAEKGISIILISSELPEIIGLSDRIVVLSHGNSRGVLNRDEITQERIMEYATIA